MVSIEREDRQRRQSGVSLVEVLVAIVVLSIGLLGLAGLQASGIRVGQSSIHRSQAAQLAYDMADRIRVNFAGRAAYNLALDAAPTGTTVASRDLQDWRQRLQMLPAGTGSVAINGSQATIIVQWDDARGAATQQQITQFQITAQLAN
jgi:type IV pilus assembly protein PilV